MKKAIPLLSIALGSLAALPGNASAAIVLYTDKAAFLSMLTTSFEDDFAAAGGGGPIVRSGSGFTVTHSAPASGLYFFPALEALGNNNTGDDMVAQFSATPATAAGADFFSSDVTDTFTFTTITITATTATGSLSGTVSPSSFTTDVFLGFISDEPLTGLTVTALGSDFLGYDNFIVGTAVPEPASAALGLASLLTLTRRRRSR